MSDPIIRAVTIYRCPVCYRSFYDMGEYDTHVPGCQEEARARRVATGTVFIDRRGQDLAVGTVRGRTGRDILICDAAFVDVRGGSFHAGVTAGHYTDPCRITVTTEAEARKEFREYMQRIARRYLSDILDSDSGEEVSS